MQTLAMQPVRLENDFIIPRPVFPLHQSSQNETDAAYTPPVQVNGELCWSTSSFEGSAKYIVELESADLKDIDKAVAAFKASSEPMQMIDSTTFPLSDSLIQKLRDISDAVHQGQGFKVLRGLNLSNYPDDESTIIFCGLASYVGKDRAASKHGMGMDHLRDAIKDQKPKDNPDILLHPSKTMVPLKYHADRKFADILALCIKSLAAQGGNQYLASAWTVYNDLLANDPESLRILMQDFPWPGLVNDIPTITYHPVIFFHRERVYCQLVYRIFDTTNILSSEQWAALKKLEACANRHGIRLETRAGDIQFVNNLSLLHARDAWYDSTDRQRHFLRLGLRDPNNAWPRPPAYKWLLDDPFEIPNAKQLIPITDYDPYGLTSLDSDNHG